MTYYAVHRLGWRSLGEGFDEESWSALRVSDSEATGWPVRLFADPKAARAFRLELEAAALDVVNPFDYFDSLADATGMDETEAARWVRSLGLPPPAVGEEYAPGFARYRWREWYAAVAGDLTDDQRRRFRERLTRAEFYSIVTVDLED